MKARMPHESNDNESPPATALHAEPDAHGQAALLLVESLIHELVAQSALTPATAVDVIETATNVSREIAEDRGASAETLRTSQSLLSAISQSLSRDIR